MHKYKVITKSINSAAINKASKYIGKIAYMHGSKVLMALGLSGFASSIIWTAKIAPNAKKELDETKEALGVDKLEPIDTVKIVGKNYIPIILLAGLSTGCIVGGHIVDYKKYSTLAAMYALSESTIREYMSKSIETVSKEKVEEIKDKMISNRIDEKPLIESEIINTGTGSQLCYEPISDKYFYSSMDYIKDSFNNLNYQINKGDDITSNDVLYELKLGGSLLFGDNHYWNLDETGLIDFRFSSKLKDGRTPCLCVIYSNLPKYRQY